MNRTKAHSWAGHVSSELCWGGVGVMMLVVAGVHISAADHHNT